MDEKVFEAVLKEKQGKKNGDSFWDSLARKFQYPNKNAMRKAFNRELASRGLDGYTEIVPTLKIVSMDLENLPPRGYPGWGLRDQYISPEMIQDDVTLLSWAGVDAQSGRVDSDVLTPKESSAYNSKRLVTSLRNYINEVDFVIGFNWEWFDGKLLTTEITKYRLWPVRYRTIDVYQLLKKHYRLTSNSLKFVAKKFGIREKTPNEGFMLWRRCAEGDKDALEEMRVYNEGDVLSTLELYKVIAPYVGNSLPNFGVFDSSGNMICACGSKKFVEDGEWSTNSARYIRRRCTSCGAIHRDKKNLLSKEHLKNLKIRA